MTKVSTSGAIETVESDYRCWHDDAPRTASDHAIACFDYGTTAYESHEHEPLDARLAREVPDEQPEPEDQGAWDGVEREVWWSPVEEEGDEEAVSAEESALHLLRE